MEQTKRLYYEDSHMQEFAAVVISCEEMSKEKGYRIVLDQTAFFPEGGGQFGDQGWLDEMKVLDTQEKAGVIYHQTREPLPVGKTVHGRLDFEERFSRMQQHTGEHIISGIVHGMFGYDNVGFHLGAEITTLDFNGELTEEQVLEVEKRANQAVFANLPVEVLYPTKEELENMDYRSKIEIEGQVRIVRIPGIDVCACCAPHTERTGEVGLIRILSCDRHRGGCRMVMVSGMRALEDYRQKQAAVTDVSVALSSPQEKIAEAVHRLQKQLENMKEQRNRLQEVYLQQRLNELAADAKNICIFEEELDPIAARNFVNAAMERCEGICGAFIGTDETGYRYILGSRTVDMRTFSKELNTRFSGKGGGKPEMVQGSLIGGHKEIEKMINSK